MRLLFLMFSVCIVTALHAVTVAWTVPNSQYEWLARSGSEVPVVDKSKVGVYFVYTASKVDDISKIAPTKAGSTPTTVTVASATMSNTAMFSLEALANGTIGAEAEFLNLSGKSATGYFYMVVFSKESTTENLYMVAGGSQYVKGSEATTGIYDSSVTGVEPPSADDYAEISILGGTWTAAKTPEPTALALLALGMAGVALRRKVR